MPVKSHKVQLEARHSWKHSNFERDFEEKTGSSFSVFSSFLCFFEFSRFSRDFLGFLEFSWFSRVFSVLASKVGHLNFSGFPVASPAEKIIFNNLI